MSSVQFQAGYDPASNEPGYPVVESAPLSPLPRRLFRRTQRRVQELPELVGGSVLVFQSNERFALAPEGSRRLSSDIVLNASMVAVVLIKKQLVPAVATLPTITPGRRVAVRASYSCQVIDAVRVLEEGCWDVRPVLVEYLLEDAKVQMLGARVDISDNPEVQQKILARALARKALEPPEIPGMRVQLVDVSLDIYAEDGRVPLGSGGDYPEGGYGHDRFDDRRNGYHGPDDQDDSYPPDGDGR
ncbi:hypothetical protein ACQPZX_26170 [Actinoplanes sp. CA-142083]|uniref:hypothetical protein n=1 Tax=Actinoplanes sp. CA-142083 TaxID=3239903 RepID=UPI003D8C72FB